MLEPGTRVDRYVVESVLGRGGMAVVYKVRHADLDTYHALKVLNALDPVVRDRLAREGRVQGTLRHPNVVAVTDLVEVGGQSGLIMEFVDGPSLDALLDRHRLTIAQADALVHGLLLGVMHAHRHGFVHRDLKPANVLLAQSDAGLVPKVTDFGLAKLILGDGPAQGATRTGVMMGTPAYMSPEQIRDSKSVDQRADVFSLGVVLYESVLGQRPFQGDDVMQILQAVCGGRYKPPSEVFAGIPPRMADAIQGALQVRRDDRIPDVASLLEIWQGKQKRAVVAERSFEGMPEDLLPLPDWAPGAPTVVTARTHRPMPNLDDLQIATSTERATPQPVDSIDPSRSSDRIEPPEDFRARFPWLALSLLAVVGLTAGVGVAWAQGWLPTPATTAVSAPPAVSVPAVAPSTRPAPRPSPSARAVDEKKRAPAGVFAEVGLSDRDGVPVEDLRPTPDATHAMITVDGALGRLVRGGAIVSPGEPLEPGRWTVEIAWDGHDWRAIGAIEALAGEVVAVRCDAARARCDGPLDMGTPPR